ncbi:MAG: hypothetical protein LBD35_00715 [Prevotellaceae bacterium]|jgi:hypothetical protein|nr:hypothetical protein [Prevotellaceae bacterium]
MTKLVTFPTWNFFLTVAFIACFSCSKREDPPVPPLPTRTVVVYMVADNSLDFMVDHDVNELEHAWNDKFDGNMTVYIDRRGKTPYILKIQADKSSKVVSPQIKTYAEQNSCSPEVMAKVVADIKSLCPAQSYGMIFWSHASGWLPGTSAVTRAFGEDGDYDMEISDLAKLPGKYDFFIFDACNMANVEVAYELRRNADYIVASVMEVLADGFPYDKVLEQLFKPQADLVEFAKGFMAYYRAYNPASGTISVVDARKFDELAEVSASLTRKYANRIAGLDVSQIQPYDIEEYFFDFGDYVAALSGNDPGLETFRRVLSEAVVFEDHTSEVFTQSGTIEVARSSGLSCHIPQRIPALDSYYRRTSWYKRVYGE